MARSIRFVRRSVQGRARQNFNWPGVISARSVVHITAAECGFGTTQINQVPPTQDFHYHLGAANVWISNIGPHKNEFSGEAGGVEFHINVDWPSPIDVAITITVEDELPEEIQGF
ncbi:hypothetical protein [Marinivivus vitaminiproducens]|uniref:hypothetical protein n=1 Tax=Marinivivus vitaminiproducens TaxID=3035935 RepID=UPI00279FF869|nr:hypothetical protein P4R82_05645 [Geminicoccaceae bacterium SCSIO 64248]